MTDTARNSLIAVVRLIITAAKPEINITIQLRCNQPLDNMADAREKSQCGSCQPGSAAHKSANIESTLKTQNHLPALCSTTSLQVCIIQFLLEQESRTITSMEPENPNDLPARLASKFELGYPLMETMVAPPASLLTIWTEAVEEEIDGFTYEQHLAMAIINYIDDTFGPIKADPLKHGYVPKLDIAGLVAQMFKLWSFRDSKGCDVFQARVIPTLVQAWETYHVTLEEKSYKGGSLGKKDEGSCSYNSNSASVGGEVAAKNTVKNQRVTRHSARTPSMSPETTSLHIILKLSPRSLRRIERERVVKQDSSRSSGRKRKCCDSKSTLRSSQDTPRSKFGKRLKIAKRPDKKKDSVAESNSSSSSLTSTLTSPSISSSTNNRILMNGSYDPPDKDKRWCTCRLLQEGRAMIQCTANGGCISKEWYHADCVGFKTKELSQIIQFVCTTCEMAGLGRSLLKSNLKDFALKKTPGKAVKPF